MPVLLVNSPLRANGLGGLVGAYAGAAATVFALEAAFAALSRAAQAENIVKGTNALAAAVGQAGPQILKNIKDITDGQLSLAEAAQNANIALSAGFNATQIEGLVGVANKAAKALGRNLTDAIQRVIRGTSKLEPELLDELGIFVRIKPATEAYARQLGVAATALSEFQRRQAFANAAIDEGDRKFSVINTTAASSQKSLEQLLAKVQDLSTTFLQSVAGGLTGFVDFLNDNATAGLLAFGVLLRTVFSKSTSMIKEFAAGRVTQLIHRYSKSRR